MSRAEKAAFSELFVACEQAFGRGGTGKREEREGP